MALNLNVNFNKRDTNLGHINEYSPNNLEIRLFDIKQQFAKWLQNNLWYNFPRIGYLIPQLMHGSIYASNLKKLYVRALSI